MGIDASRSINRNRSIKAERRNGFRSMLCENLERRELLAGNILDLDFRLLSVAPNTGDILSNTRSNVLNESPRELIFRFAGGQDVLQSSLKNGIRLTRAGGDGVFGSGGVSTDIIVTPEYLDFADPSDKRVVVARFSQPLPDDLYNVEVFGMDITAQGINAVRTVNNDPLKPRKAGTDRDTYTFDLELGSKITAVIPQPLRRSVSGVLSQQLDTIEVYFNDSELYDRRISTGDLAPAQDPTVVDPKYYNLIFTNDSVSPFDDKVYNPSKITFDPALKKATLQFSTNIDQLGGSGTYRLRIGSDSPISSQVNNTTVPTVIPAADPAGYLSGAFSINSGTPISNSFSTILEQEIRTVSNPLLLDYPGSAQDPGKRDIQDDRSLRSPDVIWGPANYTPDTSSQITTIKYNFMENEAYGVDSAGRRLFTSISSEQKQRVREVMEFYSRYLGVDFVEYIGPTAPGIFNIVVGDMYPLSTPSNPKRSGPGDLLGAAGLAPNPDNPFESWNMAIMDGSEPWDNAFGFGVSQKPLGAEVVPTGQQAQQGPFSFFTTSMHEIGHLLGLDHSYDAPAGTIMGSDSNGGTTNANGGVVGSRLNSNANPLEQVFPGTIDQVNGQHLFRPDNRDVDLYKFQLSTSGQARLETFAERLNNSSTLDTYITLLKQDTVTGQLSIVAANDNYFSQDSLVDVALEPGTYFVAVTGKGNEDADPQVADTGSGATSQGKYQLRFDFKQTTTSNITEQTFTSSAKGSALDGDGDGIAGGDFNYWLRAVGGYGSAATSPRTLVVDKAYTGLTTTGSLATPFKNISDAVNVARPGDIIRLAGQDDSNPLPPLTNVRAYEIGKGAFGSTLSDGDRLEVPKGVTLIIDAGAVLKLGGSRILVGSNGVIDRSGAAIQVLGKPNLPVYFTSYTDESLGIDTNPLATTPKPGDWGGIEIRNDFDRSQGRSDLEREGIFLNTISNARMTYGGGLVGSGAQAKVTSPIELGEARPLIIGNSITKSADSAISADPNSFEETLFTEPRYQNAGSFVPDYRRVGPSIYGNDIRQNTINGLFVRVDTLPGQPLKSLTTHARIDDSEITLVFGENLVIDGTPGGPLNEIVGPNTTLMQLTPVIPTSGSGFTTASAVDYIVTYIDRFGQESLPSSSTTVVVPANRSVQLSNIPVATSDYVSRKIWRRVNAAGPYQLAALLNRDDTTFVDNNITLNGSLQTLGLTEINRARQDASLVIDPGIVAKLLGTRIEVGVGATLLAEGTEAKPIVFTSRLDDRYGAGGTFDTNNEGSASRGGAGNWSGILARHLSTLSIDNARIMFGGGESRIPGGFASFNVIEMDQATARIANSVIENNGSGRTNAGSTNRDARGNNDGAAIFVLSSQPVIINNIIRNNSAANTAAISVDTTSLNSKAVRDTGRSTGYNKRDPNLGLGNYGPLVFNNRLGGNGLNGMRVRGGTLTNESVWDDTDIVHILQSEIIVPNMQTYGGLRLVSKVDSSLVIKASNNAGITAAGNPLDIKDRIGGTVQVLGSPGFPVVLTSLADDSIGAGFDFQGASLRDTNNDGSASTPQPGDWRSVRFTQFSNDRNVDMTYELESDRIASKGTNDTPFSAQDIGRLAGDIKLGDENLRLGISLTGAIASPKDVDVYRFSGIAGSTIWFDVDQSAGSLDSVLELIDESGKVMAQSDDSIDESLAKTSLANPAYPTAIKAFPMDQVSTSIQNANAAGSNVDFQGSNPRDAGMRVVLPGVSGTTNTYYVRVRSSSHVPGVVTDPYDITKGVTVGAYKLHLRLQEKQEYAGSTVRYADLRYATNGVEIFGNPSHSPLVGEFAELSNDASSDPSSALNIGNTMLNDRAGVSIAGTLSTAGDIDWYNFEVARDADSVQQSNSSGRAHGSMVFDIDYADGVGRANTQLWIFSRDPASGQLTLVTTADDSNIQDDQPAALKGTDQTDLTRGSLGKRDAYIGPIELPPGQYSVAVTNKSKTYFGLRQFTQADVTQLPGAANIRLEPLDSVARLGEDRFEPFPVQTTASGSPAVFGGASVPFTLSDVTLFASTANVMTFSDPLTGALEAGMSRDGNNVQTYVNNLSAADIAVSAAGSAMGIALPPAGFLVTDTNAGQIFGIDIGDTPLPQAGVTTSGITTWGLYNDSGTLAVRQSQIPGPTTVGDGMVFTAISYSKIQATNRATFFGVATRHQTGGFNENPLINPVTKNIIYQLNPDTGAAINWNGAATRTTADYLNGVVNISTTAQTDIVEAGYFTSAVGTVNGLATIGTNKVFGVTNQGELVTPNIAGLTTASRVVIRDPVTNQPINFTGLSAGPANVEDGKFADMLFGVSTAGKLYAFNQAGVLQPIFPMGAKSVDFALGAAVTGIDFSSLDANLWHTSNIDPESTLGTGHGRSQTFNNSGDSQTGGNYAFRFAVPSNLTNQNVFGTDNFAGMPNTYAMPGGAFGAFESTMLDLSSYSASDQPVMYFNYNLKTQNNTANTDGNIFGNGDNQAFLDSFRVYGAGEDGQWILLTTNNSAGFVDTSYADGALFPPFSEYDVPRNGNQDAFGKSYLTQQAFDNQGWRQARVELGSLAGKRDVKIRFEFNSGGDFQTNDPTMGGIELSAIPGNRISDGKTFQISTPTKPNTVFEFDLGLALNVPSGKSLAFGSQLKIGSDIYTFSSVAGANLIPFTVNDSPATIAQSISAVLGAAGYTVITSTGATNVLNITQLNNVRLPNSVNPDDYDILGADKAIITGKPGVVAGNVPVFVDNSMVAYDDTAPTPAPNVRDAIRTALAGALNVAGQTANVDVWRYYRDTIKLYGTGVSVDDPGILRLSGGRVGDSFGPKDTNVPVLQAALRGQNNGSTGTPMSVTIDDIVISFAERGELVSNAQAAPPVFLDTFAYELLGGPGGAPAPELETGAYQLEIRTAPDYGKTEGTKLAIDPVPFVGPKGRTFDTNDRLVKGIALDTAGLAGTIGDGYNFTLSNGVNEVRFEFNVFTSANASDPAYRPNTPGRIRIPLSPSATDTQIALAIRNAINDSSVRAALGITADINGDMFGTSLYNTAHATKIQLNGNAASNLFGDSNFTFLDSTGVPSASALAVIKYGQDTQWGEDIGDGNIIRDQGQMIISGAAITRSAQFGINLLPAPRDLSDRFINMDQVSTQPFATRQKALSANSIVRSYPGSVRNLITLNNSRVITGPVLVNNILNANGSGGIKVGGDNTIGQPDAPVPVARIVNNTIYGQNAGAGQSGIDVDPNTSPSILSNIIANLQTGIKVANDPTLISSIVVGANLYQGNGTNVTPANINQSFPISLTAADPLFMDPTKDRFYLKAGSQAIDSSISSLEDRNLLDQVRSAVGLPTSPIIAPEFDAYGLLRSDDPTVSTPGGLGSNVFADRGALDRVDSEGPIAILQRPLDNDSAGIDLDGSNTYVQLKSGNIDYFEVLIDERQGTGPDPLSINATNVVLTENGRMLSAGVDYVFGYSFNSRTIRLTPLAGYWRKDSVYELTLINKPTLRIIAPNDAASRTDGQTFSVTLTGGAKRTLELDSGYTLTVPSGGVADGQFFTYTPAGGETVRFEFNLAGDTKTTYGSQVITFTNSDTQTTLASKIATALNPVVKQKGWPVQTIGSGRVAVGGNAGDVLDVSGSSLTLTGAPGVVAGNTAVRFLPIASFDAVALANQLTQSLNQIGSGVRAYSLASGLVFIEGVSAFSDVQSLSLVPIIDLAGNLLQANRANSLTQFTILMPETAVDYGDAVERPGTGSNSSTLLADNGVRHGLYPDDSNLLVLGAFADGDTDGKPSNAADGDDFGSSLDPNTLSSYISINANGPARLETKPVSVNSFGKTLTITDAIGNVVTYQYVDTTHPLTNVTFAPVDLTGLSSATDTSTALKNAILNSILNGQITGIHAVSTGNVVSLGGTSAHLFDVSQAGSEITRSLKGTLGLTINSNLTGLTAGQSLILTDGAGNTVGYQIVNTNPTAPAFSLSVGNYAIGVDLSTATASDVAAALANAINTSIRDLRLKIPAVSAAGAVLVIQNDDEDGFSYNNWFNKKALPTPITLTASGSGFVDAWIDWNQDNDFSDPGEQILLSEPVVAGSNTFYIPTPTNAAIGFTTARFRLSTTGGLFTYGLGIGGEVEDHLIEVLSGAPPVGANDRFQTAEDNVLKVNAPGVLANDVDPDLDPIRVFDSDRSQPGVQPVLGPQNGYLTLNADGSFVYTPKQDFFGTDTFIYYVTDRRMTSNLPVTVTVTVTPVNDAPVAVDDTVTILEDAPTTWNGSVFTANDRTQPKRPAGSDGALYDTNEAGQILRIIDAQLVKDRGLGEQLTLVNNVLTYNPPKDYNNRIDGPILVRILIQDSGVAGGDELPKSPGADDLPPTLTYSTLTINIQDVNDRPQFTIPTPVNVPLEDASVTEPNFLTLIDPSPLTALDELGPTTATPSLLRQSIQFLVRALDPTRFTVAGQPKISPNGTLTYTLNSDVNLLNSGPILVEVIAQDNGNAPGSRPGIPDLNQSLPQTFTITPTEVNDAPQFVLPNPIISINEDLEVSPSPSFATSIQAGPSTALDELGLISGVTGQKVRFQVDALDPTRFNGPAGQPKIAPNGTLTYDLNPDVNILNSGDIVVRVYALDDGPAAGSRPGIPDVNRSADQFFTIRATEVNDAPQFTIANPIVTIREDLENSPVTAFVTNIQAGPSTAVDELGLVPGVPGQTVSFVVSAVDPTKFSVQPAISPTGVLTYDLAPDVNLLNSGDILINVFAVDNGPAAGSRPGIPDVNRSASVQLTIRATEVNDAPQFSIANPVVAINEDLEVSPLVGFVNNILAGPLTARDELGLVPGVPGQTVSFVVTAVDPTRFLVQPSINAAGDLVYDLNPDVNLLNSGDILVKVKAVDNGPAAGSRPGIPDVNESVEQTFTIRVTEVNDAPLFTIPNPVISIFEDLEVSPVAGFVTNILAGPLTARDELALVNGVPGQSVAFTVTAVDPTKFTTQPAIAPNGTLTYDLAPDVNRLNSGDILVRVVAIDNGPAAPTRPGIPDVNRSTVQTFTIRVTEVNDPPIFTMAATTLNLREDAGFQTVPNFITNLGPGPLTATDEVNQTTTIIAQAIDPLAFSTLPLVTGTGDLTYQVAPDVNRLFTNRDLRIRLIATDNGIPNETTIKTLTLNVAEINDAPQYTIPSSVVNVFEDNESVTGSTPTSVPGFATNVRPGPTTALDEVNQKLTFNIFFSSNPNLFSVQPSIDAAGKLTFVTAPDQNGTAVFFVRLEDDGAASPFPNTNVGPNATFTIIIKPVNDAPQFTIPATTTSDEDQGVVTLAGFASAIRPGPITAADESIQELTFDVVAVDPSAFLVQPSLLVDGTLTYQMAKDINRNSGKDTRVVVTLRDNGLGSPAPNTNTSASKTFTISVNPTNDPPIPAGYLTSTSEDTRVTIQSADVIAKDLPGPADEIAEGQTIRMTNIESTTAQGGTILPVISNGRIVRFDYIPPLNFVGQDLVRYVITDDATYKPGPQSATGTLTINVGPINDPPVFTAGGNVAVLEDSAPYSGPWATDIAAGPPGALDEISGPNAQTVGFEITTTNDAVFSKLPAVNSTGQLSFTLAKDANGTVVVVVTAVDSGPSSPPPNNNRSKPATFTITVAPVNDAPDFTVTRSINIDEDSGAFTGIILSNIVPAIGNNSVPPTALDESNQSVTISTSTDRPNLFSAQPTIDANGVLRFTPALNANGSAIVFVVATDNGPGTFPNVNVSATKSFTIAIRPVNDAPIAINDRYSTSETTILNVVAPGVLANDTDVDLPDDALSVASFQSTSDLGAKVTVKSDGSLAYDPTGSARIRALVDGQTATDTFTYRIQDRAGLLSNLATVTVTVSGFNDPPVAVNDSFSVPFGASQLLSVLANDFDVDTPLDLGSIEIGRLAIHGTATATPTGKVLYTPVAGFRGSDSFTYRVRDSLGKFSNEATVSITVNTAPVAVPDSFVVKQGTQTKLKLTGNDYDPDGTINPTSVVVVTPSPVASATVQPDGQVLFIPQAGYTGTTKFQYVVSDNDGLSSNVADVTVRVVASLYQNPNNQYDVNADTFVSPIDVLVLVNLLNSQGPSIPVDGLPGPPDYVDVNGDGRVDPLDVLKLIDFINAGGNSGSGGEGEGSLVVGVQAAPPPELVRAAEARNSAVQQAGILKDLLDESVPYGPQMLTDSTGEIDPMDSYIALLSNDESANRKKGSLDEVFSDDDWLS